MGTVFVLLVLIIAVIFALYSSRQHFRGEGDCCGGTHDSETEKCLHHVVEKRKVFISGIRCQGCQAKIRNTINRVPYLACQKITEQQAVIVASLKIDDEEIKNIIENTGYKVIKMEKV